MKWLKSQAGKLLLLTLLLWGKDAVAGIRIPSLLELKMDSETLVTLATNKQLIIVHPKEQTHLTRGDKERLVSTQFVSAGVLIKAPVGAVRSVVTDYDRYEEFIPQTEDVKVLRKQGNRTLIHYDLNFEFSVISVGVEYDLEMRDQENGAIIWRLVRGDMAENYGSWEFIPVSGGKETLAVYTVWSDLRSMGFVVRKVLQAQPDLEQAIAVSTAALVSDALRKRVEKLFPVVAEPQASEAGTKPTGGAK